MVACTVACNCTESLDLVEIIELISCIMCSQHRLSYVVLYGLVQTNTSVSLKTKSISTDNPNISKTQKVGPHICPQDEYLLRFIAILRTVTTLKTPKLSP